MVRRALVVAVCFWISSLNLSRAEPCGDPCERTEPTRPLLTSGDTQLVVVTGGAGFIGSNLVDKLLALGYWVRVLDNLSTGDARFLPVDHPRLQLMYVDITLYDAVLEGMTRPWTHKVSAVVHLAAMSKVVPSLGDPSAVDLCIATNVQGTANVLRALLAAKQSGAATQDAAVVYAGSSTFYGNSKPPFNEERTQFQATSPYAASKYQGEILLQTFDHMYGLKSTILRFFMVWGPRQPSTGSYAIVTGIFKKQKQAGEMLTVQGDGSHSRDFVHVEDVAVAIVLAMQRRVSGPTAINVGAGQSTTIQQIADMVSKHQKRLPERAHDLIATCADTCRAKKLLEFSAAHSFEAEFKAAVEAQGKTNETSQFAPYWQDKSAITTHQLEYFQRAKAAVLVSGGGGLLDEWGTAGRWNILLSGVGVLVLLFGVYWKCCSGSFKFKGKRHTAVVGRQLSV